jgi:hypothetical protein
LLVAAVLVLLVTALAVVEAEAYFQELCLLPQELRTL